MRQAQKGIVAPIVTSKYIGGPLLFLAICGLIGLLFAVWYIALPLLILVIALNWKQFWPALKSEFVNNKPYDKFANKR